MTDIPSSQSEKQPMTDRDYEEMSKAGMIPEWLGTNLNPEVAKLDEQIFAKVNDVQEVPDDGSAPTQGEQLQPKKDRLHTYSEEVQQYPKVDKLRELKKLAKLLEDPKLSPAEFERIAEIVDLRGKQLSEELVQ